jgi:aminoglycoside phosphotransferase (APT) family kinase protein
MGVIGGISVDIAQLAEALSVVLSGRYGTDVTVADLRRDSAGASRLTYAFDAHVVDANTGDQAIAHPLILRMAPAGAGPGAGVALAQEAALMRAAADVGVPTPEVVAAGGPDAPLGTEFVIMDRIEGETIPRRILRSPELADTRPRLAAQCGEILAAIHRIPTNAPALALDRSDQLDTWRALLAATGEPYPALEYAARRLALKRPAVGHSTVVHGDFRNGNLIVGPDGIRAVLDWELAHIGDPLEDFGWLCAKAWRFGSPLPVGGFGTYDDLIATYESATGDTVDRVALHWWEMFGVFKWAVVCVMQAQRHLTGGERSVEFAALGRRVAENEWDLLQMLPSPPT